MVESVSESKLSKFNMAQATLQRMNTCLVKAFNHYQHGNVIKWYFELKGLRMQIIAKLENREREKLKELEKNIQINLVKSADRTKAIDYIEEYNTLLQDLMEQKGLLLIDKEDESIFT